MLTLRKYISAKHTTVLKKKPYNATKKKYYSKHQYNPFCYLPKNKCTDTANKYPKHY